MMLLLKNLQAVIAFGKVKIVEDTAEKIYALELLADKYSPNVNKNLREKEISRFNAVKILILEVEHLSGKAAREIIRNGEIA